MTEAPTPFTAYPRQPTASGYGAIDKFQALGEGYFGLNWVFAANIALVVGAGLMPRREPALALGYVALMVVLIAGLSYPLNRRIAYGRNWPNACAAIASVLLGINSLFLGGLVGYLVMQLLAVDEMRRYGIKAPLLGLRKNAFESAMSEMRKAGSTAMEFSAPPKW